MDDEPPAPDDASFGEQMLQRMVYSLYRIEGRLDAIVAAQQSAVTELEGISISLSRVDGCLGGLAAVQQKATTELKSIERAVGQMNGATKDRGVSFGWEAFSHPIFSVVAFIGLYAARWMELISLPEAVMIFFGVAICQRLEALAKRR
jgi:hypothetical protein